MPNFLPKVIMIGNPRTGSGSMHHLLGIHEVLLSSPVTRNERASVMRLKYSDIWDKTFKFGFVRHPIKRFISAYCTVPIMDIQAAMAYNPVIFTKQSKYFDEDIDFIGRYERINTDWRKMLRKAKLPYWPLPHTNKRPDPTKPQIIDHHPVPHKFNDIKKLTKEQEEFVREYYKEDFIRFKYV